VAPGPADDAGTPPGPCASPAPDFYTPARTPPASQARPSSRATPPESVTGPWLTPLTADASPPPRPRGSPGTRRSPVPIESSESGSRASGGHEATPLLGLPGTPDLPGASRGRPSAGGGAGGPPAGGRRLEYADSSDSEAEALPSRPSSPGGSRGPSSTGRPSTIGGASPLSGCSPVLGPGGRRIPGDGPADEPESHRAFMLKRTLSVPHNLPAYRDRAGVHATGFGAKHLTGPGCFALNLNNMVGPALVLLPLLNQQAGWLSTQVLGTLFCVVSVLVSGMLVEAMQRIPGNKGFNERYEFVTLMRHYFGEPRGPRRRACIIACIIACRTPQDPPRLTPGGAPCRPAPAGKRGFVVGQVAYNLTMVATNVAQMIVTVQVMDRILHHALGTSVAVNYGQWPPALAWHPQGHPWTDRCPAGVDDCTAGGVENHVSLGFFVSLLICLPLGRVDLEGNMWFQYVSCGGFFLFLALFLYEFARLMLSPPAEGGTAGLWPSPLTPAVTDLFDQASVLGVTLFFHAYIVTVPSWVNEKTRGVSVSKALWYPTYVTLAFKVVFGLAGAWAFQLLSGYGADRGGPLPDAGNILKFMLNEVRAPPAPPRPPRAGPGADDPARAPGRPRPAPPRPPRRSTRW